MSTIDFLASLLKMISALAVVLGVMLAGLWAVRKFMNKTGSRVDSGQMIRVLSTRYLGPKSSILLLDVLGSVIVVGLSGGRMSLLTTITDEDSLERLRSTGPGEIEAQPFLDPISLYKRKLKTLSLVGGQGEPK
ncbi:MAG TPA: flagellar biosynthetic protein FliO [Syntrophales bacterium]|jgi:flagellar biosynthetic protein FliO|nr:flagellar biosynthetic protein FliO [Syntrophales bacterium]HNZ35585.1 flagellar biosynthetic protein FliO [Syntrophales bacterium]HOH45769.1 flagellar biosynthetic protein FliO [Syntrophales bacterium]HPV54378.1 flagellar biosynthetic protein FliO [Syntrophales bacterium]